MKHELKSICILGLTLCNLSQTQAAGTSNWLAISNQLYDAWNRCVSISYKRQLTRVADKNAVAESAFRACKSDEDEIVVLENEHMMPSAFWLHYKSQAKVVLIEEGTITTP